MPVVYELVVYSTTDENYRRVVCKSEDYNKLCKAMLGLDRQLRETCYSVIETVGEPKEVNNG